MSGLWDSGQAHRAQGIAKGPGEIGWEFKRLEELTMFATVLWPAKIIVLYGMSRGRSFITDVVLPNLSNDFLIVQTLLQARVFLLQGGVFLD